MWLDFWLEDTDFWGNDLPDGSIKPSSHEQCWELCDQRPDCSAFTYTGEMCILKSTGPPNPSNKINMKSAFKTCYKGGKHKAMEALVPDRI